MNTIRHLVTTAVLTLVAGSAQAWGEREQGFVAGIAGAWLFNQLSRPDPQPPWVVPPAPAVTPAPVYVYPEPPVYVYRPRCYYVPTVDHYGRVLYYRQRCY